MINKNTIAIAVAVTAGLIAAGAVIKNKFFKDSELGVENLEQFDSATSVDHDFAEIVINTAFESIGEEMKESAVPAEQAMNFASEVDAVLKFWREHRGEGAKVMYTKNKANGETIMVSFAVICAGHPNRYATVEYKAI